MAADAYTEHARDGEAVQVTVAGGRVTLRAQAGPLATWMHMTAESARSLAADLMLAADKATPRPPPASKSEEDGA